MLLDNTDQVTDTSRRQRTPVGADRSELISGYDNELPFVTRPFRCYLCGITTRFSDLHFITQQHMTTAVYGRGHLVNINDNDHQS